MSNKKCIFIGGKQIGVNCLKQLLNREISPDIVIGNIDDDGNDKNWHESLIKLAESKDIVTIRKKRVSDLVQKIEDAKPEIIFCIGGTQLIPKDVLKIPKLGCLNIHPALLPKYRGRYSTAHAIFSGERSTGVTVHWMDEGIDSGPIIMQEKIEIDDKDTGKSLYDKFTKEGEKLFIRFVDMWLTDKDIPSKKQDESQATYYPKELPNNGKIDWSWDGKKIRNFIRAMTFEPFPPADFDIGKKNMVIIDKKYFKGFEE